MSSVAKSWIYTKREDCHKQKPLFMTTMTTTRLFKSLQDSLWSIERMVKLFSVIQVKPQWTVNVFL